MTDEPLVSVVIPTYYRNDRLRAAIESVHAQTYENTEVIVVDGGEAEHARPVAEEYGVRYVHQGDEGGAHAARSMGAERAGGRYVNFLDDDDRFHEEKLERQHLVFEANDEVGVVYCGIRWEDGHSVLPDPAVRGNVLKYALMFQMTPSSPSTMLIDRAVLDKILPFRNRHGADDMGMKIELAQRTRFEFVDAPLVQKGDSDDSLGGSRENIDGRLQLLEDYSDLYDEFPSSVYRTALAHTYLLDAELILNETVWSLDAVKKSFWACYYMPGLSVSFFGYLIASLFGSIGRRFAGKVYSRFVLGAEHRGKITTPRNTETETE